MRPKLFDTHTHFNFNAFRDDWKEVIERTLNNNVWFVNVGAEAKTSRRAVEIAKKYSEGVYASVGLHPIHTYDDVFEKKIKGERVKFVTKAEEFAKDYYADLAKSGNKVVAIGETGLDYFHIKKFPAGRRKKLRQKQIKVFQALAELARELRKPLIIHCRPEKDCDAYREILDILKNFKHPDPPAKPKDDNVKSGNDKGAAGIVHCFQANEKILGEFLDLGFMIGYNGIITFTPAYDGLVKATPLSRIALETDAPWLAPAPRREKRNESIYVKRVAQRVAELKSASFNEVAEVTTKNAMRIFNII
jgi:TatD DNase family protein